MNGKNPPNWNITNLVNEEKLNNEVLNNLEFIYVNRKANIVIDGIANIRVLFEDLQIWEGNLPNHIYFLINHED